MKDTNPKDAIANNKVPLALCSPVAHARWAEAMVSGRQKYGQYNFRVCGARASVYIEGAMRHLQRYLCGQDRDPDDLVTNLGAAMANISIVLDAEAAGTLVDDRPPSIPLDAVYADVEESIQRLRKKYDDKDPKHYTIEDTTLEVSDRMLDQAIGSLDEFFEPKFEEPAPATERPEIRGTSSADAMADYIPGVKDRGPVVEQRAFKVGDRVRSELNSFAGLVGTVAEDDGEAEDRMPYWVKFDNNDGAWFSAEELELALPTLELKVGAKVLIVDDSITTREGETGVIERFNSGYACPWFVRFEDDVKYSFAQHELEVIG